MAEIKYTIRQVSKLENIGRGEEWVRVPEENPDLYRVGITLSRECREWPAGATEVEVPKLIYDGSPQDDLIIYTDGSVLRGKRSAWRFVAKANGKSLVQDTTTSSMRMEVEEVRAALQWLENKMHTHVIVTDSEIMMRQVS